MQEHVKARRLTRARRTQEAEASLGQLDLSAREREREKELAGVIGRDPGDPISGHTGSRSSHPRLTDTPRSHTTSFHRVPKEGIVNIFCRSDPRFLFFFFRYNFYEGNFRALIFSLIEKKLL